GEAVGILPPQRGEPRVEPLRCRCGGGDGDVAGKDGVEPPGERDLGGEVAAAGNRVPRSGGQIQVRHLGPGVHARVGAPGDGEPGGFCQAQDPVAGRLELPLNGPPLGLFRPTGELGAVVAQVDSDAHRPTVPFASSPRSSAPPRYAYSLWVIQSRCRWTAGAGASKPPSSTPRAR